VNERYEGPCDVQVLLPLPLASAYDYRVPAGLDLAKGDFVVVPLGRRDVVGIVWRQGSGTIAADRLKPIAARLDVPPLPLPLCRTIEWVAAYTLNPPGAVLRMATSMSAALDSPKPSLAYRLKDARPDLRLTDARRRVIAVLDGGPARPARELALEAGVSMSVVHGLAQAGIIEQVAVVARPAFARPDPDFSAPDLSAYQEEAAARLRSAVHEDFSVTLLDGVTGSGKTEVYFEAIAETLRHGRQALVLLPEIALTAQWLGRFQARFGVRPAEWHSDLTSTQRRIAWRAVGEGRAQVVVGARSALFLPFPALGLIVVDEEHDPSYKQEDGVIYHARDMAVVRARLSAIPVVLASATPSLETAVNVSAKRYQRLHLPERHGGAALPRIEAIDMRSDPPPRQCWLSPTLRTAIAETIGAGEQVMLFLNRRGYAPLTLCRGCGHRLQCPHCTAWLVEHRLAGRIMCHHCGHNAAAPRNCPRCGAENSLAACGPGVERVAEEVAALFPEARSAIMASDTVGGPLAAEELVRQVRDHELDLLVGTQIMAKGHHFPLLTLVGVIDADLGLGGGDLRAAERTYQLLHQVSGRAGRAERAGRVLLQTYVPDHPVIAALLSGDRDQFIAAESEMRRGYGMPPFGRLAALIVSGFDSASVERVAAALGRAAPSGEGVEVFGPAPAPFALLRGRHRRRLLLKARKDIAVQPRLHEWLGRIKLPHGVRVQIDVDPYSFL
jgi:primosomal protein N' (replication factor Y)